MRFLNHYHHCRTAWEDEWHCMCNSECPTCGEKDIEPIKSEDRLPATIADFLRETPRAGVSADTAITWLIREGWDAEELSHAYQRSDVEAELAKQMKR